MPSPDLIFTNVPTKGTASFSTSQRSSAPYEWTGGGCVLGARAIGPLAYDLASSSGSAVVHDFVATLVPGPRQFDAFRADHP
jgi:hypothetical protein